jgi:hypothetical protein
MKATTSGGWVAPYEATTKSVRIGGKSGKNGQKRCPRHVVVAASNDNSDDKGSDSDEGYVIAAEHDFKRQARLPKNLFAKLLEETSPYHSYPVRHKPRDYTMMRNFMALGAFSKGRKIRGDRGGKGVAPICREAEVMTIFD